jgi:hypothetical protein
MARNAYDGKGDAVDFGDRCYGAEHYPLDMRVHQG